MNVDDEFVNEDGESIVITKINGDMIHYDIEDGEGEGQARKELFEQLFKPIAKPNNLKIVDFQKRKEEKEAREQEDGDDLPPEFKQTLKTKFCFKHKDKKGKTHIFNFVIGDCQDGVHCHYVTTRIMDMGFARGVMEQPIADLHIELNKFERFLNRIGFKFDLDSKVEKKVLKWQKFLKGKMVEMDERASKEIDLQEKYKL